LAIATSKSKRAGSKIKKKVRRMEELYSYEGVKVDGIRRKKGVKEARRRSVERGRKERRRSEEENKKYRRSSEK
jgi:hypothetical protein